MPGSSPVISGGSPGGVAHAIHKCTGTKPIAPHAPLRGARPHGLHWVQQSPPETTDGDPYVAEPGDPGYVVVARRLFH